MKKLVHYLRQNRDFLIGEWVGKTVQMASYQKMKRREVTKSCAMAYDAFCEILEYGNHEPMDTYIGWVTMVRKGQAVTLPEVQNAFSNFRYTLYPIMPLLYNGARLFDILTQINMINDSVIFRFSDYFQKYHEQKLKEHADGLEQKVKRRTRELEELGKNYSTLVEEMTDGCFLIHGGNLIFVNRAFCDMHGYALEELLNTPWQRLIAEDSKKMVLDNIDSLVNGKNFVARYVYYRKDKNNHILPTETKCKLIDYGGKKVVLGLCSDITNRLEMEEKIRQKDRLALIGQLTTSIAHEIRNPLSAIKINTQVLLENLALEGNNLRRLQITNEQSTKLEDTIAEILDFAKPIKMKYAVMSVEKIVESVIDLIEESIIVADKSVSVIKKLDENLPNITVDRQKMLQALIDITENALEALVNENGERKIEYAASEIMGDGKKYIKLSISDNGVGIDPKDMDYIFEPFFTKRKKEGVGLGLPNVKRIVDAHNGQVQVRSRKGRGTTFEITIPVDFSKKR